LRRCSPGCSARRRAPTWTRWNRWSPSLPTLA
jgi:hypothetical protein